MLTSSDTRAYILKKKVYDENIAVTLIIIFVTIEN